MSKYKVTVHNNTIPLFGDRDVPVSAVQKYWDSYLHLLSRLINQTRVSNVHQLIVESLQYAGDSFISDDGKCLWEVLAGDKQKSNRKISENQFKITVPDIGSLLCQTSRGSSFLAMVIVHKGKFFEECFEVEEQTISCFISCYSSSIDRKGEDSRSVLVENGHSDQCCVSILNPSKKNCIFLVTHTGDIHSYYYDIPDDVLKRCVNPENHETEPGSVLQKLICKQE